MPCFCATTGAFTMFTSSPTQGSSMPLSTATVIGATLRSAISPAYSISISEIPPRATWPWKRPSFSPSTMNGRSTSRSSADTDGRFTALRTTPVVR